MVEHRLTKRQAKRLENDAYRKMVRSETRGDGELSYSIYRVFRDWLQGTSDPAYSQEFLIETARRFAEYEG